MTYKEIYSKFPEYDNLSLKAKRLFDNIFPSLMLDSEKNYTNEYLAQFGGESVSSVEKHFKEFRDNNLIYCRYYTYRNGKKFIKTRIIELDPIFLAKCIQLKHENDAKKSIKRDNCVW